MQIETRKFKKALQVVALISGAKLPLQVLRSVQFADDNLISTDMERTVTINLDWLPDAIGEKLGEAPKCLVDTKALLAALPKGTFAKVSFNGKLQVGNISLPIQDVEDFPVTPSVKYNEDQHIGFVPSKELQKMLEVTIPFAADPGEIRQALRSIRVETHIEEGQEYGDVKFVATDGRRITLASTLGEQLAKEFVGIIPVESAKVLLGILKKTENFDINIYYRAPNNDDSHGMFFFLGRLWEYSCKAYQGNFPNYDALLQSHKVNSEKHIAFTVKREKLLAAVKEAIAATPRNLKSSDEYAAYALLMDAAQEGLHLSFAGSRTGSETKVDWETTIKCDIVRGDNIYTCVNPYYVSDVLTTSDEVDVTISLPSPNEMVNIDDGTTRECYIMPVRLKFFCANASATACYNRVKARGEKCSECQEKEGENGEASDSI